MNTAVGNGGVDPATTRARRIGLEVTASTMVPERCAVAAACAAALAAYRKKIAVKPAEVTPSQRKNARDIVMCCRDGATRLADSASVE